MNVYVLTLFYRNVKLTFAITSAKEMLLLVLWLRKVVPSSYQQTDSLPRIELISLLAARWPWMTSYGSDRPPQTSTRTGVLPLTISIREFWTVIFAMDLSVQPSRRLY